MTIKSHIPHHTILHFVGIGGIGMSGIAEILHVMGYKVQGSDHCGNDNTQRLESLGVKVFTGHDAQHVGHATVVVVSTAVKNDNPELKEALARHIPVVHRSEILAELMRDSHGIAVSGTHGKTTTTSLCAALLQAADLSPTVVNGGIINSFASNACIGEGSWFVAEADESDGSFVRLPARYAVVTNIDPEHMDHYQTFDRVLHAFRQFLSQVPFYGMGIVCYDHPVARRLALEITGRRMVTYGLEQGADIQAVNLRLGTHGAVFDVMVHDRLAFRSSPEGTSEGNKSHKLPQEIKNIALPLFGRHNVQNALITVALALELGLSDQVLRAALSGFQGVQRRFTKTGDALGATIIDDYAHHPAEIRAVLSAARIAADTGRVIAVFQPHRYTRLADLMDDFAASFDDADDIILAPLYAAGEAPIAGVDSETLRQKILQYMSARDKKAPEIPIVLNAENLAEMASARVKSGDFVICMGAGSISQWARALPELMSHTTTKAAG